ncbi:hypothetical protein EJ05DRAFT_59202 [Pseudovirgaria hyperparasitica]|uniref:Uncharacterized protein n=1 Tax=Pseudovirgaria hyperparasitica TaxID=470096 RepID=A0A6A6W5I7_9PEZI|nr:uncharacterized protein EJ05DRAFT_59202 [Pseudovirgaria hyperparasitica]KAF2757216.1 hypothetical protein EJ05DRAFT_59202 [Pseudovirgaria hyperparasitica]
MTCSEEINTPSVPNLCYCLNDCIFFFPPTRHRHALCFRSFFSRDNVLFVLRPPSIIIIIIIIIITYPHTHSHSQFPSVLFDTCIAAKPTSSGAVSSRTLLIEPRPKPG